MKENILVILIKIKIIQFPFFPDFYIFNKIIK